MRVQYLALLSRLRIRHCRIAVSCGVGCRQGSDPALLWLWRRPAAAAPIQPLTRELPHAAGVALKGKKKNLWSEEKSKPEGA